MDRLERFELQGVVYYQQGRKCGRPTCRCAQGLLHGPYWYARDLVSGAVKYIGKRLPVEVEAARLWHDTLLPEMTARRRELQAQADALTKLIRHAPLSAADEALLEALGFGPALVSEPRGAAGQDEGR